MGSKRRRNQHKHFSEQHKRALFIKFLQDAHMPEVIPDGQECVFCPSPIAPVDYTEALVGRLFPNGEELLITLHAHDTCLEVFKAKLPDDITVEAIPTDEHGNICLCVECRGIANEGGFTAIEVVVALLILVIVAVIVFGVVTGTGERYVERRFGAQTCLVDTRGGEEIVEGSCYRSEP